MALPTIYIDTGGATTNSGSSDNNSADLTSGGTGTTASATGTTVTFSGAVDLSGVATDGSATIRLADATNANQKIFKITGVDDGADTVTVDVAPTGVSTSAWAIGGRFLISSGNYNTDLSAAVVAGWTVQFNNSPASHSGSDFITLRAAGTDAAGPIMMKGLAGAKRVLTVSDTNQVITGNQSFWIFQNLEFVQQGASGAVIDSSGTYSFNDCAFSDGGGAGVLNANGSPALVDCEFSGLGADGINANLTIGVIGCYIHDVTGDGLEDIENTGGVIINSIFDTCAGRGIFFSDTSVTTGILTTIYGNTIYGCGNSGIETADSTALYYWLFANNIFSENGNAAGEYNVEFVGYDTALLIRGWNVFFHSGGGGGDNFLNYVANSTELTTDPAFTNAANGDFSIGSSSPAKGAGFPNTFPGGLSVGYPDIGAVQRQETASSGGSRAYGIQPIPYGV